MNLDIINRFKQHEIGDAKLQIGNCLILEGLKDVNPNLNKHKVNIK